MLPKVRVKLLSKYNDFHKAEVHLSLISQVGTTLISTKSFRNPGLFHLAVLSP